MLLIILILSFSALSQLVKFEPATYNITTEQGLPSMETYSVKQDSKGYIWITTDAGVCRYDGDEFKVFTIKDGLTDNVVFDSYEDADGRIWFLTFNSMLCYFENDRIYQYKYNDKLSALMKDNIAHQKDLWIDSKGNLFYDLYDVGILKISKEGIITRVSPSSKDVIVYSIDGVNVLSRYYSKDAIISQRNLVKINDQGSKSVLDTNVISIHSSFPKSAENLNENYLIYGGKLYDIKNREILFQANGLLDLTIKDSIFYISTLNGLVRAKLKEKKLQLLPTILESHSVSTVYFDRFNGVWISTLDGGVFYTHSILALDESNYKMNHSFGDISSICKLKNSIIVGTNNGRLLSTNEFLPLDATFPLVGSIKTVSINDHLFISNSGISVPKLHISEFGNVFYCWTANLVEKKEKVYFVHDSQVFCYDKNKNQKSATRLYYGKLDLSKNKTERILTITVSNDGKVIVGTKNALFYVKNNTLVPIPFLRTKRVDISFIHHDAFWGLIIGTRGDGVFVLKNEKLRIFSESNGLLNDHVNTISVDKNGKMYVGMPNGISVIKKNGQIGNVTKNLTLEPIDVSVIFCDDTDVYLGTKTGLLKVSEEFLNECINRNENVKATLQEIKIDEQVVQSKKSINFPSDALHLQLKFSVFQFNNWFSKKYQYKIGKSGKWVTIDRSVINFYRPSGNFDVYVRFKDAQNNWSVPSLICSVNVIIPFWQQWYFWSIIAMALVLLLFYWYQRHQQRVMDELLTSTQMLSLEQQMENARMNPHFIFNVLNSIHSYMMNEENEKADLYLMKFSKLMREILGSTKEGIIKVREETSILNKYLELEQLRFKGAFEYIVSAAESMDDLAIPSMMIQPFVENAVLYLNQIDDAPKMSIVVRFEQLSSSLLKVSITNSGIPTLEAQEKMNKSNTKNAIGITRKRLENYNKLFHSSDYGIELFVVDKKETSIELKIPIVKLISK